MCGIAGAFGPSVSRSLLEAMVESQHHRGPDARGVFVDDAGRAGLGHDRLAIIDLSPAGVNPMWSADGRYAIVFNGEIYNYEELRTELGGYPYRSRTDTEVLLAAFERWGTAALDRLVGMFAFLLWDTKERRLFAARDRFGVKPLYYSRAADGTLLLASEIKALFAAGVPAVPDEVSWATYLAHGLHDHGERTFWQGVSQLRGGHALTFEDGALETFRWYDLAERARALDERSEADVEEEYRSLLYESIRLRFRADVPVGINLSGGLDSSILLGLVQAVQGKESDVKAFTFVTGDERYDELPWVASMLERTCHPLVTCRLSPEDVPSLAASMQAVQDEPFGGLPTLAYGRLFEAARAHGVIVTLDGQGMDEQWAGYDYYQRALAGDGSPIPIVQATRPDESRRACLVPEFRALAVPLAPERPFADELRNVQLRDATRTKLPRALRFNDRASMRASVELREPFLDHRLFELAFAQPAERKLGPGGQKLLLRKIARELVPPHVREAPKRPLQTPQREWLRGPLAGWAEEQVESALERHAGAWLDRRSVRAALRDYAENGGDSSFFLWQWIGLGLTTTSGAERPEEALRA